MVLSPCLVHLVPELYLVPADPLAWFGMDLPTGNRHRGAQDVHVGVRLFRALVGHTQQIDVANWVHRPVSPLGEDVGLVPDLNILDPSPVAINEGVDEIAVILEVVRGALFVGVVLSGPVRRPVKAGDDL